MKNKKYIISIASILAIIVILAFSIFIYIDNNEKKQINTIEMLILNGDYKEAIKSIDESKSSEMLTLYKNVLGDFLEIRDESDIKKLEDKIVIFKDKYSSNLSSDNFKKINEDVLKFEEKIKSYYDEKDKDKEKIEVAINEDINSVKELLDDFKKKYPNEDISSIEDTYNKKLSDIKRQLEEKEVKEKLTEEEKIAPVDKYSNDNDENSASKLGILNTEASNHSSQIITVVSRGGSYGELVFWEKNSSGTWILVDKVAARLGQNGMKPASDVYEMDKSTPTGIYSLTEAFGISTDPGSKVRYRQLDGTEHWVDDVNSEFYNTMQFGDSNGRWTTAEKLINFPGYYDYSLVIDYNRWPVISGKSSAIFLHCDTGSYTYGCVAIPKQNLVDIIKRIDPEKDPFIIMDFSYEDIYNNY